jgi:hypothetical protein
VTRRLRLDLADWYGALPSGRYHIHLTFGADSGVGEGTTNAMEFWIVEPE